MKRHIFREFTWYEYWTLNCIFSCANAINWYNMTCLFRSVYKYVGLKCFRHNTKENLPSHHQHSYNVKFILCPTVHTTRLLIYDIRTYVHSTGSWPNWILHADTFHLSLPFKCSSPYNYTQAMTDTHPKTIGPDFEVRA